MSDRNMSSHGVHDMIAREVIKTAERYPWTSDDLPMVTQLINALKIAVAPTNGDYALQQVIDVAEMIVIECVESSQSGANAKSVVAEIIEHLSVAYRLRRHLPNYSLDDEEECGQTETISVRYDEAHDVLHIKRQTRGLKHADEAPNDCNLIVGRNANGVIVGVQIVGARRLSYREWASHPDRILLPINILARIDQWYAARIVEVTT